MQLNFSNPDVSRQPKIVSINKNHSYFMDVTHVSTRYVSDPVNDAIGQGIRALAVKSDMGSGKTYMLALQLQKQAAGEVSIIVQHLASLCRGTADRLAGLSNKTVTNYTDLTPANAADADCVVTTYNNLPRTLALLEARTVNIFALDESESGAGFMSVGTIKNKSEAGQAIQTLSSRARTVMVMDAHLGRSTIAMINRFMPEVEFTLLDNGHTPWSGYTYDWADGRDAGVAIIRYYIKRGIPVFIAVTSAALAAKIRIALDALGLLDGKRVLDAYHADGGADSIQLRAAKADHRKFMDYDIVIASPTVGTGVSIDGEHFGAVVAFFVRDKDAPDATSAMQMPFRVRNIGSKHIHCVRMDQVERGHPDSLWDIAQDQRAIDAIKSALIDAHVDDTAQAAVMRAMAMLHSAFDAEIAQIRLDGFDNYYDIIDSEFAAKGIKLVRQNLDTDDADIAQSFKGAGKKIKQANDDRVLDADAITDARADYIEMSQKYQRDTVTPEDAAALRKYKLIQTYHHDLTTEPTRDQLAQYLQMADAGLDSGRQNIERAMLDLLSINKLTKAYLSDAVYGRDVADDKAARTKTFWKLDRLLCEVAGVTMQDGRYVASDVTVDTKTLSDQGKYTGGHRASWLLHKLLAGYNATKPDKRLRHDDLLTRTTETFRMLIELRLKLKTKKVRGRDAFVVLADQPVIDHANQMAERGKTGDLRVLEDLDMRGFAPIKKVNPL